MTVRNILLAASGNFAPAGNPWDLDAVEYLGSLLPVINVQSFEAAPSGVFFKPDGLKMYLLGFGGDRVYQYDLSIAWDIRSAVQGASFSVATQDATPLQLWFSSAGTTMFVAGDGTNNIFQYTLGTAWDISTASYSSVSFSVAAQTTSVRGVTFNSTGTSLYLSSTTSSGTVFQYTLSTPWNLSTISYSGKSFSTGLIGTGNVYLTSDGLQMFVAGYQTTSTNMGIYKYTLSVAGDVSSASYSGQRVITYALDGTSTYGVFLSSAGDKLYTTNANVEESVWQYDMSTAFNPSTATFAYDQPNLFFFGQYGSLIRYPEGMYMSSDGVNLYISQNLGGVAINRFVLSTPWSIKSAVYSSAYSAAAQDGLPSGIWFDTDGTTMFVLGDVNNTVYQYTLGTAWDITTASYASKSFSVAAQTTSPQGISFSADGLTMYMNSAITDRVYQYTLGTAWDISTTSYSGKSLSVSALSSASYATYLAPNGTDFFVLNGNTTISKSVFKYTLGTAKDLSTATYSGQFFNYGTQEFDTGKIMFFKPDGLKMFVGGNSRALFEYSFV